MKLYDIINESYYESFTTRNDEYVELFIDPTKNELRKLSGKNQEVARLLLDKDHCYAWGADVEASHNTVMDYLEDLYLIPLYYIPKSNSLEVSNTYGIMNPSVAKQQVLNHPWVQRVLGTPKVTFATY